MAMVVFAWFEHRDGPGGPAPILDRLAESMSADMLPMGVVFAVFSLAIGAIDGFYRSLVRFQRDDLGRQLDVNVAFRRELESQNTALRELELTRRRMTHFLVHDLKNHLGCVLGYSQMLLSRAERSGRQERDRDALRNA